MSLAAASKKFHQYDTLDTPYGKLIKTFELEMADGSKSAVEYLNPFGLLWYICTKFETIGAFMAATVVKTEPSRVCMYTDSLVPGNPLRPDHHRTVEAYYWTMMELPDWMRSMASIGWLSCHASRVGFARLLLKSRFYIWVVVSAKPIPSCNQRFVLFFIQSSVVPLVRGGMAAINKRALDLLFPVAYS